MRNLPPPSCTATRTVTNMHDALSRISASFTSVRHSAGPLPSASLSSIRVFALIMNMAAGMPLSETSAMTMPVLPSPMSTML